VADGLGAREHLLRLFPRLIAGEDLERLREMLRLLARLVQALVGRVLARAPERLAALAIEALKRERRRVACAAVRRRRPIAHALRGVGEHAIHALELLR